MSELRKILAQLDAIKDLTESGEFAGHYKTGPAGQLKARDKVGADGAHGRLVGDSVEPSHDPIQEYMPMPEPLDEASGLSAATLQAYRQEALRDKQFNLRGIGRAVGYEQDAVSRGDLGRAEEWQDEAQFLRMINAKRQRGIARADRALAAKDRPMSEGTTVEDKLGDRKNLGDYLQDVAKIIKKDPDLLDRLSGEKDTLGPAVKTLHTPDGHEIKIHGNEDDGFRISIRNQPAKGRFRDLDEARMAVELFVSRRQGRDRDHGDYVDEK
jgi:hypothetical protein